MNLFCKGNKTPNWFLCGKAQALPFTVAFDSGTSLQPRRRGGKWQFIELEEAQVDGRIWISSRRRWITEAAV